MPSRREILLSILLLTSVVFLVTHGKTHTNAPQKEPWGFTGYGFDYCTKEHRPNTQVTQNVLSAIAERAQRDSENTSRILFIGNSHTFVNNVPQSVADILQASGQEVSVSSVTFGGWSLNKHLQDGTAQKAIEEFPWDYVVLQEQSSNTLECAHAMQEAIVAFAEIIKKHHAKPVLYMTWRRLDTITTIDPIFVSYALAAEKSRALLAPTGMVWEHISKNRPGLKLHSADGNHAAPSGSCLAAATIARTILRKSVSIPCFSEARTFLFGNSPTTEDFAKAYEESLAQLEQLEPLNVMPLGIEGYPFLGGIYADLGYKQRALQTWKTYLQKGGTNPVVREAIDYVQKSLWASRVSRRAPKELGEF